MNIRSPPQGHLLSHLVSGLFSGYPEHHAGPVYYEIMVNRPGEQEVSRVLCSSWIYAD